jgi:hypothetical protein
MEPFYTRFGFQRIEREHMPRYFHRMERAARLLARFTPLKPIIVMRRDGEASAGNSR